MRRVFVVSILLLFYTFFAYPALLALLARVRPRPARLDAGHTPDVSLVISAFNEASSIERKLDNCAALDYPSDRLQVIVVADGSDDGTERLAARQGIEVVFEPARRGKAAAMVRGVAAARGEVIVFSDANNLYAPQAIRALVAPLADPKVGVVTGKKAIAREDGRLLGRSEGLYWRYESKIKEWESAIGSTTGVAGEALAVRREAYVPPRIGAVLDDFELAMSAALAGWRVVYAPEAVSYEPASATLADEEARRSRLVAGRVLALSWLLPGLARRQPLLALQVVSHKGLRAVVPYAMAGAAVSNLFLLRTRLGRLAALVQIAFYVAALIGRREERRGNRRLLFYLPYYFCRVNLSAVRGLLELARKRDYSRWERVRRG